MAKKNKGSWDLVAQQIKSAQGKVERLNQRKEIMSGKGHGDLTGMSKAEQTMWFNLGRRMTSDKYKKSQAGFTGSMSNQEYDKYVRKGIAAEYTGWDSFMISPSDGWLANQKAQRKKKKRIV